MADQDQISGKIVIEIQEALNALNQIGASLQKTNETMQAGFRQMTSQSKESTQQIKADVEKMSSGIISSIKDMHGQISGVMGQITSTITGLGGAFAGIAALLGGGSLFKGMVDSYVELNLEAKKLSQQMGISAWARPAR
jgi:uncharacterized phage infection (PIP) family protein YhgE